MCNVDTSKYLSLQMTGNTGGTGLGYVWCPYVPAQNMSIISDNMDWVKIKRQEQIKYRKEKIEKINNKIINGQLK